MQSIFDTLLSFILMLLGFIVAAVAFVEVAARALLSSIGIHGQFQTVLLLCLLCALIVVAFRIFGRLLAVLLTAAFVVYLLHSLLGIPHNVPVRGSAQEKAITL